MLLLMEERVINGSCYCEIDKIEYKILEYTHFDKFN